MKRCLTAFILLGTCLSGSALSQSDAERTILSAQDQRDGAALTRFFSDEDSGIRQRVALAAGSVQDTSHIAALFSLLEDPSVPVRSMAAFALGQLNDVLTERQRAEVSERLLGRLLRGERDAAVRSSLIQALGKAGNRASYEALIDAATAWKPDEESEVALAIGRYAYRSIKSISATSFLAAALEQRRDWREAYALMRLGADSLLHAVGADMVRAFRAGDADTRMLLATAFGWEGGVDHIMLLLDAAERDPDWRVRVNAIKALSLLRHHDARIVSTVLGLASDTNEYVSLTALSVLPQLFRDAARPSTPLFQELAAMMENEDISRQRRGAAATALAGLFGERSLKELKACSGRGLCSEADYVRSLGLMAGPEAFDELARFAASDDAHVRRSALEGLLGIVRAFPRESAQHALAANILLEAIRSPDLAVMTTAADGLGDSLFADQSFAAPLSRRLRELSVPGDVEAMVSMIGALETIASPEAVPALEEMVHSPDRTVAIAAAGALEVITGKSYLNQVSSHSTIDHVDYDWEYLHGLKGATVRVVTGAGSFVFELLPDEAPFTCINFARLIEKGFYDGLIFHRVVPNFVVQGGDPRGDGWGGPGYSIRSEFITRSYDRGTVGVASAGKDTEGCQFFVTQSRQPHLDGRYTIFGKVVEGMDVVDRIQAGDQIVRMTLARPR